MTKRNLVVVAVMVIVLSGFALAQNGELAQRLDNIARYIIALTAERDEYQDLVEELAKVPDQRTNEIIMRHMEKLKRAEKAREKAQQQVANGRRP